MNANRKEGFIRYFQPHYLDDNYVWRDSWDAYFHQDGTIADVRFGVAALEVQDLARNAFQVGHGIYTNLEFLGMLPPSKRTKYLAKAEEYEQKAEFLKAGLLRDFWFEDEKGEGFGLGRDVRGLMRIRHSDMLHLFSSDLLKGNNPDIVKRREAVLEMVFGPELFCAGGFRTVGKSEDRFKPELYHLGSCWPYQAYLAAFGFVSHGYFGLARHIIDQQNINMQIVKGYPERFRGGDEPFASINDKIIVIKDDKYDRVVKLEPPHHFQGFTASGKAGVEALNIPNQALDSDKKYFEEKILDRLNAS